MEQIGPNPKLILRQYGAPMTLRDAETALGRLRRARPELFDAPTPDGYLRGIDYYRAEDLLTVFRQASNLFFHAHGRFPDLITPHATIDGFFAMKFFEPVRLPGPGDKLTVPDYLSPETLAAVGLPKRPWVSLDAELPPDDAVPAGRYLYKFASGNSMQVALEWPLAPAERARIEAEAARWSQAKFGLRWGEWWYSVAPPRYFLEEDLTQQMTGRPEVRIFVRDGRVQLFWMTFETDSEPKRQRLFNADLEVLHAESKEGRIAVDDPPPEQAALMLRAAAEIGRHFGVVRVDFMNVPGPHPIIGEVTLCHNNAIIPFQPRRFDQALYLKLFG
ncbi:MAG: hypothetical protein AAGD13_15520 [Pseudomonadota bacterium]